MRHRLYFGMFEFSGFDSSLSSFPFRTRRSSGTEGNKLHSPEDRNTQSVEVVVERHTWRSGKQESRCRNKDFHWFALSWILAVRFARKKKSRGKNNDFRYEAAKVFGTPVMSCPLSEGAAAFSCLACLFLTDWWWRHSSTNVSWLNTNCYYVTRNIIVT